MFADQLIISPYVIVRYNYELRISVSLDFCNFINMLHYVSYIII
jgi:hypothetical protein